MKYLLWMRPPFVWLLESRENTFISFQRICLSDHLSSMQLKMTMFLLLLHMKVYEGN